MILGVITLFMINFPSATGEESLSINQVAADIQSGRITRIIQDDTNHLIVIYKDANQTEREAQKEAESTLVDQLIAFGVTAEQLSPNNLKLEIQPPSPWVGVINFAVYFLPIIAIGFIFWFFFRQAQGSKHHSIRRHPGLRDG